MADTYLSAVSDRAEDCWTPSPPQTPARMTRCVGDPVLDLSVEDPREEEEVPPAPTLLPPPSPPSPPPPRVDTSPLILEQTDTIDKGDSDPRSYRWLRLRNNLQVVLVSDPQTDRAAAAMDVAVGSVSDPEELPGLAHFLEHMLFLGTEKYPNTDEYQSYLEQHGGSSNAFTSHENTSYYFEVQREFLPGALDRFAQFFLCPLFSESAAEREINAVDSENSKNLQSDAWRLLQLMKGAAHTAHPWSRFNCGSRETLQDKPAAGSDAPRSVRDALIAFYEQQYSANRMAVAVLGRESLDDLEQITLPLFAAVADKGLTPPVWPSQPYPDERLRRWFRVVPVRDSSSLTVMWPLPSLRMEYATKPFRCVSHVLGHEGKGSLLSLLKRKVWSADSGERAVGSG
jgi:insulysin